jgi:hypothetical protein
VHPQGSQINAAEYPATLLGSTPALFRTDCLQHLIESNPGEGNEEIRQQPLRVLPPERFCLPTEASRNCYPYIFLAFGVTVTAGGIAMYFKRVYFSA